MKNSKLLFFYHPTTTILIDDDEIFLKNVVLRLGLDIPYKTYRDPKLALSHLRNINTENKLLSRVITASENNWEEGKCPMNFEIASLYQEIYNEEQFSEISVVVVDYSMAKMSGAELLKELMDIPVKKIMLTGQADEALAVQLFNDGVIDKFILKNSLSLQRPLEESIKCLQQEYFQELSDVLSKVLPDQLEFSKDAKFAEFFNELVTRLSISSYYLIDTSGSFLLLDNRACPLWFLVRSMKEMEEFAKQAASEGAPKDVVNALLQGEKMAYFSNFDEYLDATSGNWHKYLYSTNALNAERSYRYVITDKLSGFSLEQNHVLSFNSYLQSGLSAQSIM